MNLLSAATTSILSCLEQSWDCKLFMKMMSSMTAVASTSHITPHIDYSNALQMSVLIHIVKPIQMAPDPLLTKVY